MRSLGDDYVKAEFRRHKDITNKVHIIGFLSQWKVYLDQLPAGPSEAKSFKGKPLDPTVLEKVSINARDSLYHTLILTAPFMTFSNHDPSPWGVQMVGLSFADLGKTIDHDEVWVAALFYGQAKATPEELAKLGEVLDVPATSLQAEIGEQWFPRRGLGPVPPQDPLIYRLFEGVLVYGTPIKALIHEKFGDGIMSMIDCKVSVDRKENPKGDRVILTFEWVSWEVPALPQVVED
ncbi:hypothetical protein BN946_scf184298.g13 [Trametes cinnabarina]|uniref:Cyanate lyase C-terminal domain-containing protein n=1 Tax=Pycnoporus cinnabarinus TaxID=5643 RepID=A0A060SS40_PYCCI|nr:hypothetical protein BN946_scf184298.g13 [Trametes cinnabarina]